MESKIIVNDRIRIDDIRHTDLHMHTVFCDGKNTPEEMVLSAMEKGLECIGFSGHSYVDFDPECGMDEKNAALYFAEVARLKEKYAGKIRILCGVEQDCFSTVPTDMYDYVIGSVHYLRINDNTQQGGYVYVAVDDEPEMLLNAMQRYFDNDPYKMAQNYFDLETQVADMTGCDIVGHFDLISKFNEKYHFMDEKDPRYIKAWRKAADRLIHQGRIFEINTGAISRGWRTVPYPDQQMQEYIGSAGGRFILSSDSHEAGNIGFGFYSII